MSTVIQSILSNEDIEHVRNTKYKDRLHPLKQLLAQTDDRGKKVTVNTEWALSEILSADNQWISKIKPRLINLDDFSSSSSALAEIRAYGYLLMCGLKVKAIPKGPSPTPEFVVSNGNDKVFIEVFSKQLHDEESKALNNFHNREITFKPGEHASVDIIEVAPFGKPAMGECVTENVISRLASIKNKEQQFSSTEPSILWIDFQDEIWRFGLEDNSSLPIRTWRGEFYSGEIWYAFYGWKGAPIFARHTIEKRISRKQFTMKHTGRFNPENKPETKIDAVVFSFPYTLIVLENHLSKKPAKPWFWEQFSQLPWFCFEYSHINWPNVDLSQRLKIQKDMLIALSKKAIYSW